MNTLFPRRTVLAAATSCSTVAALSGLVPTDAQAHAARLRVAAVYSLPFEHLWVQRLHQALSQAKEDGQIVYRAFENVLPQQYPALLRELAQNGTEVIFGESHFDERAVRQVAREFPKTAFAWWSLKPPHTDNFNVFENSVHEPAYLAGMLGAGLSTTKHLGLVGGFDMRHHRTIMNAFMAGAREVEPKVRFSTGVINSWFNPVRGCRMTHTMLAKGADTFLALTHAGVTETAFQHKALAFNCMANVQHAYPRTVVAAVMWNPQPMVETMLRHVGSRRAPLYHKASLANGNAQLSALSPHFAAQAPAELLQRVREREAQITAGHFTVPVNDQLRFNTV